MENNNLQFELFRQPKLPNQRKDEFNGRSFIFSIRNHEKTVLLITAFIIASIISFSLGVEKGKKIASLKSDSRLDLASKTKVIQEVKEEPKKQTEPTMSLANGYTIQLACYKTMSYASREADVLKKKGLAPVIQEKGDYVVLCVGNFPSKETAKSLLSKLKNRYEGCYIRRL